MATLNQPSDFYDAIADELARRLAAGVAVKSYGDFSPAEAIDATVLIEFGEIAPAPRSHDGRTGHQCEITLHAVMGRQRQRAELDAINLAAALQQVVNENLWQLPYRQVDTPRDIQADPSLFKAGAEGYEAWGVRFRQCIYLGPSLLEDDPVVRDVWLAVTPPADVDDPDQYDEIPRD